MSDTTETARTRPRVLIVDDDPLIRDVYVRALGSAGMDVLIANDGEMAQTIAGETHLDLMLLDSRLPGLSGPEIVAKLRAHPSTRQLPVILVTGASDVAERVHALELGADDFLTKPVDLAELVARARTQVRRGSGDLKIRRFLESLNDAHVAWDAQGAITDWNARAEALFGWQKSDAIGRPYVSTVLAPQHRDQETRRVERALSTGERPLLGEWVEMIGQHRDGRTIPIELTMWTVRDQDGVTFNAFIRSLAHRFEVENALRQSARMQSLVDSSPDVIVLTDRNGVILYASPSITGVLGYDPDEIDGRVSDDLVHPEDQRIVTNTRVRAVETGFGATLSYRLRARDGSYVWVEASGVALRDDADVITGLETTWRDITQRKLIEVERERVALELERANSELRAAIAREQRMVGELQELDRIKNDFVSTVSHELRTPLASISGYVEMLADETAGDLSTQQHEMLEIVERNTHRLLVMIENLLTIGRIESGAFSVQTEPIDLTPVVVDCVNAMLPTARERQVELEAEIDPDLVEVLADAGQLDRALLNLVSNAIKFTPAGGKVVVRAGRTGKAISISVRDTGIGIPLEEQSKLFTPFFRSSRAAADEIQGTGLGLVIVKTIVEGHGGRLRVDSAPGIGTTVTFTLPVAPDAAVPVREEESWRQSSSSMTMQTSASSSHSN